MVCHNNKGTGLRYIFAADYFKPENQFKNNQTEIFYNDI